MLISTAAPDIQLNTSMTSIPKTISSRRAILAFSLGLCFFCYAFVQRVLPSVMIDELMTGLAVGGAALGLLSGAYFYAYASMQIPVGMLIDRFGPRHLLSLAMLVCVFASAWMAVSETLLSAGFARALIGAAVAFGFVGTLAIIARFFPPHRFALMVGLVQSAGMLGAVLGQAPLRLLVEQLSWRGSLWTLAGVALVLSIVLWIFLPSHEASKPHPAKKSKSKSSLRAVVSRRQNWLGAGLGFGLAATMLAFTGLWAVPWLEQVYGMSTAAAASLASLNFIGNAFGSPLLGWWSDRIGKRKPVLIFGALSGLITTILIIYGGLWSTPVLAVLIFCSGLAPATIPTTFACVRELNAPFVAGTALGLINMFVVGSGAVLQPMIGKLLDAQSSAQESTDVMTYTDSSYSFAFSTLVIANAIALLCALWIRESNCENATSSSEETP